jgi:lipid A 3-O-deacylase
MRVCLPFCLAVLVNFYSISANGGFTESVGQEIVSAPIQAPTYGGLMSAVEETPTVAPYGRDRHYTNGAKLAYTTGSLGDNSIWNAPIRWLGGSTFLFNRPTAETDDRLEWNILGQSIFTPQNHLASNPSLNDRPYAAWLYTGLEFIQNLDNRQLTSLEFLGGIVGPWALGRQVQNNVHALFGEKLARGWNHQLGNEFGFTTSWRRRWRFNHSLGEGYSWEIIPEAGIAAGNVFAFGEAGSLIRWGRGLHADWGPEMILPGYSGTSYFAGDRAGVRFGFDFYLGTEGRLVARNIFLDGNTFQNSRSVTKEHVVADLIAGTELFFSKGFRLGFSIITRTPEFRKQHGVDTFGGFNGTYAF